MESMESCTVPPGFRFHPTDEELVGYYLRKKVASQKIDLDVIRDIDLYRIEPWDLQERCRIGYEEQNEWYFFSHKDKKYPTGTRTNRATVAGFWKATGRDKAVYDKSKLIGMRKTLVFYKGRAPNGQKTDWIMHEYRLESDENGPPQEEGWVACRAFKKRNNVRTKSYINEGSWDSSYFYEETSGGSLVVDPIPIDQYILSRQPHYVLTQNMIMCKEEIIEADNFTTTLIMQSSENNNFLQQLPRLGSPSLQSVERPSSMSSLVLEPTNNHNSNEEEYQDGAKGPSKHKKKVTDWRALDKFVASQFSQVDRQNETDDGLSSGFEVHNNTTSDNNMALLLLQSTTDEGNKLPSFLNTSTDCDIGICVYQK